MQRTGDGSYGNMQPNFSSPTFEGLRNQIIGGTQTTHEEVAADLSTTWQQDHNLCTTEDTRLAAEATKAEQEQAEQEHLWLELKAETELWMAVGDTLTPRPSQYAIHKLKSFEYIKLWYFSPDGCKTTADEAKTNADDTFGLTKVDNFVALKPRQFDLAKNSYLLHINKLKWPEKHQWVLTMFFMNIVAHPSCSENFGEQALLLYAAHVHHDWHNTLVLNNAFDISVFNLTLPKNMTEEVWNKACHDTLTKVSSLKRLSY
ncbi:hypothetical protein BDR07DRAFT_1449378 [Suillus spraguei]|nr:hypothetical protein BDR07DRAFT_1449378 [Suillus spraguei]